MDDRMRAVGLANELNNFKEWLAEAASRTELFAISGIAGIGKTTLLMEMAREAERAGALTLWMDGNSDLSTPLAFLTSIEMTLAGEYGVIRPAETPMLPFVVQELSRRTCVMLLDNAESIERLEGWLLSSFLPRLAEARLLIAIASRNGLPVKWRTNPHWGNRARFFRLGPMSRQEVRAYLRMSGLAEETQARIASETEGHPLLLALTVDWMRSGQDDGIRRIPSLITAELLREVATPRLQHALTAMSLLPPTDLSLLNRLLDDALGPMDAHELSRLSIVQSDMHGLALHPLAARMLRDDYAATFPESFRRLRGKAFGLLAERFRESGKRYQMRIASHILDLYREYLPSTGEYAIFASPVRTGEQLPFGHEDLPELQRLLARSVAEQNWQTELAKPSDYAALLDDIARLSPEGICVLRDETGKPIAFSAGMMLHEGTIRVLRQYSPDILSLLEKETVDWRISSEEADTILMLLAAVDSSGELYRPEELGGALMLQWLILMTVGLRGIMVSGDPQLNGLLTLFGFRNTGTAREAARWEIDFRRRSFEEWVQHVILQTAKGIEDGGEKESGVTGLLAEEDAKRILRHLYDENNVLDGYSGRAGQPRSLEELREKVRFLLSEAPPVPPLTSTDQRILRELYMSGDRNRNELADELHMSRTTLYRHTKAALRRFASALNRP